MMNKSKQAKLDKIKTQIVADKVCPELAVGATQLVFGNGNPDADIVFIGEAPGKNEDIQGLPFVGAAGKFLNEMLAQIGLVREDVYITNIVKYRPPDNRDPYPDEKIAFLPYLREQLAVIGPKIVITLGRHSMECFLPELKISQCHGQPKRIGIQNSESRIKNNTQSSDDSNSQFAIPNSQFPATQSLVILPLFHPAAALYNGGMRQTLIDDFMKIPAILEQIDEGQLDLPAHQKVRDGELIIKANQAAPLVRGSASQTPSDNRLQLEL